MLLYRIVLFVYVNLSVDKHGYSKLRVLKWWLWIIIIYVYILTGQSKLTLMYVVVDNNDICIYINRTT